MVSVSRLVFVGFDIFLSLLIAQFQGQKNQKKNQRQRHTCCSQHGAGGERHSLIVQPCATVHLPACMEVPLSWASHYEYSDTEFHPAGHCSLFQNSCMKRNKALFQFSSRYHFIVYPYHLKPAFPATEIN